MLTQDEDDLSVSSKSWQDGTGQEPAADDLHALHSSDF